MDISAYQELMKNISEINSLSVEERNAAEIVAPLYGAHPDKWEQNAALYMISATVTSLILCLNEALLTKIVYVRLCDHGL
jgi:hypothetical protein